ncbi:MAG TPA: amidohydrolase family protein, partial [Candidatus Limnocylindria bacterium]
TQVTTGPWTDGLRRFLAHPLAMVGTDSTFYGEKPSPRTYGSYPRILGQFVRDEALLSLEEAVRKMTGAPAARLGLRDRGLLRDGFAADVVLFDPEHVRARATYDEPRRFPDGIEHVIVNGTPVIAGGVHTGATPGRALRRGR